MPSVPRPGASSQSHSPLLPSLGSGVGGDCLPRDTLSPALESFLRGDPSPSPRPIHLLPLPGQDHQSVLSASFLPPTTEGARPSRNPARGAYLWLPAETTQQPGKCLPNCPNVLVLSAHAAPSPYTSHTPHTPQHHTHTSLKEKQCPAGTFGTCSARPCRRVPPLTPSYL